MMKIQSATFNGGSVWISQNFTLFSMHKNGLKPKTWTRNLSPLPPIGERAWSRGAISLIDGL